MERISSGSNQRIRRLILLNSRARERQAEGVFVIEGLRLVEDSPKEAVQELYIEEGFLDKLPPALAERIAGVWSSRVVVLPAALFRKVSNTQTPQGILAVVRLPSWKWEDLAGAAKDKAPLLLIAEDIQDPGNLGTMFRTAEAAGATGIITTRNCVDLFNPKTVRATMSSVFRVPFYITEDIQQTIRQLRQQKVRTFAAWLGSGQERRFYDTCDYRQGTAFLIGNEGNGLQPSTAAAADARIQIPMEGQIESLNAAMSAGILLYEAHRQRENIRKAIT